LIVLLSGFLVGFNIGIINMALFNQTNNMDPIELFKWFQERKANASLPKSQQSNALGSKPGDVGTGELSPVEDYFASMWEKTQQSIEAARKELAPTMEEAAKRSAEQAATLRSKMGITDSRDNLASVVASMGKGKDDMQAEASIPAPLPRPTKEEVAIEIPAPLPRPEGKGLMAKATEDGAIPLEQRIEQRLIIEEGFEDEAYKPKASEQYLTIGYGHYGPDVKPDMKISEEEAKNLLRKDIAERMPEIKKAIKNYDNLSDELKVEIAQSWFRGGIAGSPDTIGLINKGDFKSAATEFLDNDEYRTTELSGVKRRMEALASALEKEEE
jgi:lysozyme